jgi:catechol 2,3-dioxygenase-like lactoylglutathione lyase family enzyme
MPPTIDHLALPARDPGAAARFLAEVLGLEPPMPDGPDGDMINLRLGPGAPDILFVEAATVAPQHVAFRVDRPELDAAVALLTERGIRFGNDPEHVDNGETSDPLGGAGRVYFVDPDGHLFELTAATTGQDRTNR